MGRFRRPQAGDGQSPCTHVRFSFTRQTSNRLDRSCPGRKLAIHEMTWLSNLVVVCAAAALTLWRARTSTSVHDEVPTAFNRIAASTIPNAGRGVFAGLAYEAGELVERSPWIELSNVGFVSAVGLSTYIFDSHEPGEQLLLLGHGGLFNHASPPNLRYGPSTRAERSFDFNATRHIEAGEELFIHYGYNPARLTDS